MIKEDRIITRKNLKQLCVDFDLYTLGTSEEYEEMLKSEEIPYKWKAIIRHYLLKETSPDTTMENHIFFMKEDDFAYETFQELKASFKMSVWIEADGKRHKHGHYESREYKISEIVQSEELHRKMDTIIVEELHLTKLALMMFSV